MSNEVSKEARVTPLRPACAHTAGSRTEPAEKEPLWRDLIGDVLRRERRAQGRTLKEVADAARISLPYLSEIERGRKEASSEVLAAAAHALGLDLGGLLSRAHTALARTATAHAAPTGSTTAVGHPVTPRRSPYDALSLAA